MDKVEYIDKNAVKRILPEHGPQDYVDPYEIPGFYEALDDVPVIDAIPIDWIKSYVISTGKALLPFMALINEWRRINGQ